MYELFTGLCQLFLVGVVIAILRGGWRDLKKLATHVDYLEQNQKTQP